MTDKIEGGEGESLSAEETAFFESGGETAIVEAPVAEAPVIEPDTDAQADIEGRPRDEKGKFVPHQALHAEREEHKKTRSELQELKEFRARMEERLSWVEKIGQQPQPEPVKETAPDPEQDIFAALKYERDKRVALEQSIAKQQADQAAEIHQQKAEKAVWDYWDAATAEFKTTQADFGDAATWLAETRSKQLAALGVVDQRFKNPHAINAQINEELKQIIVVAAQQKISPAEAVYNLATQWGYTPKRAAQAAAAAPGALELPESLQRIQKAQEASRTVAQASGKAGGDELSADTLANMPQHEFEAWVADPANARRFKALMGG